VCACCKKSHPLADYYADKNRHDGLSTWCKDCKNAGRRAFFAAHYVAERERVSKWQRANPEKTRDYARNQRARRRQLLLNHYGGRCACCGESHWQFLAIDHINGGGTKHRAEIGKGEAFFKWLIREGLPEGFRCLCHNCNQAMGFYGACPHTLSTEVLNEDLVART
jgi:hypothetical protein